MLILFPLGVYSKLTVPSETAEHAVKPAAGAGAYRSFAPDDLYGYGPAMDSASSYETGIENSTGAENSARKRDALRSRDSKEGAHAKKDNNALLKKGKELIKKNTELIKTMEKEFKKIADDKEPRAGKPLDTKIESRMTGSASAGGAPFDREMAAGASPKNKAGPLKISSTDKIRTSNTFETKKSVKITIPAKAIEIINESQTKGKTVSGDKPGTDRASSQQPDIYPLSAGPLPASNGGPIKKLTDLFFKSAIVTKNEILSKENSAALIESSNKIRSIIQQLQKIYDTQIGILKMFLDGKENPGIPYEENEKPKDVMKYQVIEVTEKKK